jgi:hypothetical protein
MLAIVLNFDTDIRQRAHAELQIDTPAWRDLMVGEQLVKLAPFVSAQVARDAQRKQVA